MLKKALCLLLVLVCSLSIFACGSGDNANVPADDKESLNNPEENGSGNDSENSGAENPGFVADTVVIQPSECYSYIALVKNSNPNVITTQETVLNTAKLGSLTSVYKTYVIGEDEYVFEYLYERFNQIGEGDGMKYTVPANGKPGTLYYKDGSYSYDGVTWLTAHPDANVLNVKFDLTKENIDKARKLTLSEDGKLTIETSAAEAEKILGVQISTKKNVEITLVSNGLRLWQIIVEYTQDSNKVIIETSYTYEQTNTEN